MERILSDDFLIDFLWLSKKSIPLALARTSPANKIAIMQNQINNLLDNDVVRPTTTHP
jgi:hypothetical protein